LVKADIKGILGDEKTREDAATTTTTTTTVVVVVVFQD
jgi:hypothetical protein